MNETPAPGDCSRPVSAWVADGAAPNSASLGHQPGKRTGNVPLVAPGLNVDEQEQGLGYRVVQQPDQELEESDMEVGHALFFLPRGLLIQCGGRSGALSGLSGSGSTGAGGICGAAGGSAAASRRATAASIRSAAVAACSAAISARLAASCAAD